MDNPKHSCMIEIILFAVILACLWLAGAWGSGDPYWWW